MAFVAIAFLLGLTTKLYRDSHPHPPPDIDQKHSLLRRLTSPPAVTPKQAQRKPRRQEPSPTPLPSPSSPDENEADGQ